MNIKLKTFVAGVVGMMVTFGITELVHGFYEPVPPATIL
jgi:hypothetical protein